MFSYTKTITSNCQRVQFTLTPGKGEYLVFKDDSEMTPDPASFTSCLVPVPSKRTAGVYIFKSVYGHTVVGPTNIEQKDRYRLEARTIS